MSTAAFNITVNKKNVSNYCNWLVISFDIYTKVNMQVTFLKSKHKPTHHGYRSAPPLCIYRYSLYRPTREYAVPLWISKIR